MCDEEVGKVDGTIEERNDDTKYGEEERDAREEREECEEVKGVDKLEDEVACDEDVGKEVCGEGEVFDVTELKRGTSIEDLAAAEGDTAAECTENEFGAKGKTAPLSEFTARED